MATLTGTTIQSTYDSLLKVTDNDAITATLKRITDGLGNNTPLYLSSSAVEISSGLNVVGSLTASNVSGSNTGDETKSSIETKLGAATASNSGFLTSSDWSTFNNKIAGVGTLNTVAKFSSTGSIADSNITDTGSIVTISGNANIAGSGGLGIAQTSLTGYNIRVSRQMTGATTAHSIAVDGFVDSTVTTQANGFFANIPVTGAFTLPSLAYFRASGSVTTGGATITNQFGFTAGGGLVNATNNYAFHSSLAAGTGRWNLYMEGTANNFIAGSLGIGQTALTGHNLRLGRSITGATTSFGVRVDGTVQSDVTGVAYYYDSTASTQATTFTLGQLTHYRAAQGTLGAGSTVTDQIGFLVASSLIGAGWNYGFRGQIPAGANRWNIYMDGTANNYINGALGISATTLAGFHINIGRTLTGAVTSRGIHQSYSVASDVTNAAIINSTSISTQAAAFTLPQLTHYFASQVTIGAGSVVTNQNGFRVDNTLIGATNNYAFKGEIASGTGRWNLFMDGTANNHMTGSLGIGTTSLTGYNLRVGKSITGATTSYGIVSDGVVQSDVTANVFNYSSQLRTQAATFNIGTYSHYLADQTSIGAGNTIINQYGFVAQSTMIGATNNFGFTGGIPAGTGRWNLYMVGTARNFLAGTTSIGSTTDNGTGALLQVAGGITYQNIFNRQTANYTLVLTDQNDIVETNVATANTVTVPTNASVAFPIGTEIFVMQYGAGQTSFVAASGVTIRSKANALKIGSQYTGACLVKVGTDEWYLVGSLVL